LNMRSGFGLV